MSAAMTSQTGPPVLVRGTSPSTTSVIVETGSPRTS
jgi:hypothetical protein